MKKIILIVCVLCFFIESNAQETTGGSRDNYPVIGNGDVDNMSEGDNDETEVRRRHFILDCLERYRTAYLVKDIDFLEKFLSNDELIFVGSNVVSRPGIELTGLDKQCLLEFVKRRFRLKDGCQVSIDSIEVKRSSDPELPNLYGVTLQQTFISSDYSDKGYLFMLWDFTDEEHPRSLVRTWQPYRLSDGSELPKENIISLEKISKIFSR